MKRLLACALAGLTLLTVTDARADTPPALAAVLAKVSPDAPPTSVQPSAIPGLYEVIFGSTVYYFSADGKHMLGGPLVELASRRNLSAAALQKVEREQLMPQRVAFLKELRDADAIVFAAAKPQHRITVFTDIDCGYCRELHRHVGQYNAAGISVRYVAFPRAGEGSESFKKAENVWCAADRKAALTDAKAGKTVPDKVCENPVAEQFHAGEKIGVSGTPAILLDDGRLLPGYVPPDELKRVLEQPAG
ncbi:thioredoxin fold domain-containing protein [Immundisolibacter cernigliae]|uniref:thioredoxin fold domain-containing protein n=1 Tax=Immundisolibacter cernigliae TaxID=1810504 RepID=UPI00083A977F|nr:thioredoxin fold domain-containing protein [Immundisolibacter cernigliae]